MSHVEQPDNAPDIIAELLRRVRILETAPRAAHTSITDPAGNELIRLSRGGLEFLDAAGNPVVVLDAAGLRMLDPAGVTRTLVGLISGSNYGIRVRDAANGIRFSIENDGYKDPWLAHPWRNVVTPDRASTTSATFVDLWGGRVELVTHQGVVASSAWVTDGATTGEVRLRRGASVTSAVALGAGAAGAQQFKWLHGANLGDGPLDFHLQARRTGGAGSVHLDQPFGGLEMADPDQCTATGL